MSKIPFTESKATSSNEYQIIRTVNGNLEFGINIRSTSPTSTITPGTPDLEFTINHNLGYIPSGFLILSKDAACDVYSSRVSDWTTSQIFLKCSAATINLVLVVL